MPAPSYGSSSHASNASSTTSLTIPAPSGIVNGNILILSVYYEYTGSVTVTPPAGFAEITGAAADNVGSTPNCHLRVYWKRASGESGSYTVTFSVAVATNATIARYSGAVASGNPIEAAASTTGNGTSCVLPSITTLTNDTLVIGVACSYEWLNSWTSSALTERTETDAHAVGDVAQASAGASGTKVWTQNATNYFLGAIFNLASTAPGTTVNGAVAINAAGSVAAVGRVTYSAAVSIAAAGTVSCTGGLAQHGAVAISAVGAITCTGGLIQSGAVTMAAVGTVTCTGGLIQSGAVVLAATSAVTVSGAVLVGGATSITASAALSVSASLELHGAAAISGIGTVTVAAAVVYNAAVTVSSTGSLAASGRLLVSASTTVACSAVVTAVGTVVTAGYVYGAVVISSTTSLSAAGSLILPGSTTISVASQLITDAKVNRGGQVAVAAATTLVAAAGVIHNAVLSIAGTVSVAVVGSVISVIGEPGTMTTVISAPAITTVYAAGRMAVVTAPSGSIITEVV